MRPRQVLVLGGSGFVGRAFCAALAAHDPTCGITVPTRRLGHAQHLRALPAVRIEAASVHDDAALARLLPGHDAVVNLIAILHGSPAAFQQAHQTLPQRLAQACAQAGVRRFLHVSALGVAPDAPSNYLRSKAAGEATLQAAAAAGTLDLTLLRPSVIFGAGDRFLNLFATLQAVAPLLPLAGTQARFQPVWVEDVAQALLTCLLDDRTIGQTYQCAGPEVMTLADIVRAAGRWSGHARPILPLPEFVGRLQALAMECLPGEPLMSRDNVDSMRVPNVADPAQPGLAQLGITPQALGAIAPAYLAPGQGLARLDAFRACARR